MSAINMIVTSLSGQNTLIDTHANITYACDSKSYVLRQANWGGSL